MGYSAGRQEICFVHQSPFFLSQQHREPHTHTLPLRSLTHLPLPPHTLLLPLAGGGAVSCVAAPVSQPLVEVEAMLAAALHAEAKERNDVCVLFQPHLLTLSPSRAHRFRPQQEREIRQGGGEICQFGKWHIMHVARSSSLHRSCSVRGNAAVACTLFTCAHPFAFHSSHLPPTLNC
jgi:hypothetical protein